MEILVDSSVILDILTVNPIIHAEVSGMTLLTRDAARYHTYFPTLRIIAPT